MGCIMMRFPEGRGKAFTMSYDDGVAQDIRLLEIMAEHELRGTFNINTGLFSPDVQTEKGRMNREQAFALYRKYGMEVAVHCLTHPHLESLTAAQVTYEILTDRKNIEDATGVITRGMAYPYGTYNDTVLNALRACGIAYSRTVVSTERFDIPQDWLRLPATCHHNNPRLTDLGNRFLSASLRPVDPPLMFYLWGHSYEFDTNNNWDVIRNFAGLIGGHSDVWYATNIELHDYIESYRSLIFSSDGTKVYNPTAMCVWFVYCGTETSVLPGETKSL